MLNLLETKTNCEHLSATMPDMPDRVYARTSEVKADIEPENSRLKTAIIAVGNPLKEEDSVAIAFMQSVQAILPSEKYCTFNFDNGFAWFKQVLLTHDRVVVIDSMLGSADTSDGVLTASMTNEVLDDSGFVIRASHGLSWLDEIKMVDEDQRGTPIFIGIDGNKYRVCNETERVELLNTAMRVLKSILERWVVEEIGGNSNA